MRFYIVDAFAEQIFGGNPAGVVLLSEGADYPPDEVMQKTAAELRYSETAFIMEKGPGRFQLRYFTPAAEVDLCGHATIGSFYALLDAGKVSIGETCIAETLAGEIEISLGKGFVMMDMAAPESLGIISKKTEVDRLYVVMGLTEAADRIPLDDQWELFPEIISTGLPDILLPVKDVDALARIKPDFPALAALSETYGVVGVHAFAPGEGLIGSECCEGTCDLGQVTAYCRNFAPAFGIDEEAATGTSNGALTYYLYKNALIDAGSSCRFLQGEDMGRPSIILSNVGSDESNLKIRVGGSAAILAKGEILI